MADLETVRNHFGRSSELLQRVARDADILAAVDAISARITAIFRAGSKVLFAGNGGSAADAQHLAAEFLSRFTTDRNPLPAIALTTDTSVLTAIANDYGYEHVFERQVRGLGKKGDGFVAISTSGRSPNVLAALRAARESGLTTIGFTGSEGAEMRPLCDLVLAVPSTETALIQQVHLVAYHAICSRVESDLFPPAGRRKG